MINSISEDDEKLIDDYISPERLLYAKRFKFRHLQLQEKISYILLRMGLFGEYDMVECPKISVGKYGKPYLTEHHNIYFSISHCKKGIACGISKSEIGIDIQEYIPYDQGMAKMFMSEEEMQSIREENKNKTFTKIWALKESYGKYEGKGICYNMKSVSIEKKCPFSEVFFYPEFVLAVTSEEKNDRIYVTLDEIIKICSDLKKAII